MKLETAKSFILVILIGISIILSYSLWNYQPSSNERLGGDIVGNEMNALGSGDETRSSLIKPLKVIFHTATGHYGFDNPHDQNEMFEEMQTWAITDFEVYNSEPSDDRAEGIEFIFPEEIPMELLESLLSFQTEEINFPDWTMKRVFISFIHDSKSLQIEFASEETDQHATALINDPSNYEELVGHIERLDRNVLREYLVLNEGEHAVYFPSGEPDIPTYSITPSKINPSLFVNILFPDPAVVRETSSQTIGAAYFTDNRQMNVYQNEMRMEYIRHVSPASDQEETQVTTLSEMDLLDYSISRINNHKGWTQEFRLADIDMERLEITYQMYYKGYPVFNNSKLATIDQRWGDYHNTVQLIEYDRPLWRYSPDREFLLRESEDIASGERVLAYLEQNPSISLENIQDITLGYRLIYQQEDGKSEFLEMKPAWYKQENDSWQRIVFDEEFMPQGGD